MRLGVYTGVLHDRSLRDALSTIRSLGLVGAEINAGGFLPTPHLPVAELLSGRVEHEEYLAAFVDTGVALTGLNAIRCTPTPKWDPRTPSTFAARSGSRPSWVSGGW
jgi:sugar phosphate isomerase/epimerase